MTAKEYLNMAYTHSRSISNKIERIRRLKEMAESATSSRTAERVSGTSQRSRVEDCVVALTDLQNELASEIIISLEIEREMSAIISKIRNHRYRCILESRYIFGLTFEEIADDMYCTKQNVIGLHKSAARVFEKIRNMNKP